ncbi:MAG: monomethylamine:corrinoid methyltransferase [Spirochaetia bacterium]|jgi:methylamine---corrinoid protein Co-methyltransferase|nr:monomethylamine:corrinoid methyltransferase [Spirochaetia bacterium]
MKQKPDLIEILRRSREGEYCSAHDWDLKKIPKGVKSMIKKYGLANSVDKDNPVNMDMDLADTFYKAGYELALELGMLNEARDRIVKIDQDELDSTLHLAPSELKIGFGQDQRVMRSRTPSDPTPMLFGSSLGITISEDVWPLLTEGIARQLEVDILEGGSLCTINGLDALPNDPSETLLCYEQGRMHRQIRKKAGREGMPGIGNISAVTEFGQFCYGTKGNFYNTDLSLILYPSEMKINNQTLHKVVHTLAMDGMIFAGSPGMIGGMPGTPEGAVISSIAASLLQYAILFASVGGGELYDIRYLSNVNREGLWALSMTHQALSRNTHLITHGIANQVSGPGTKELLYETLAGVAVIAASGAAFSTGPRSAGGKLNDYLSPLDCRWCAEVAHAASGMALSDVNELVKQVLPKFESTIKSPNIGKPVQEVWDLKNFRPLPEAEAVYDQVRKEAVEFGLPL